jgi:hypothetical protein
MKKPSPSPWASPHLRCSTIGACPCGGRRNALPRTEPAELWPRRRVAGAALAAQGHARPLGRSRICGARVRDVARQPEFRRRSPRRHPERPTRRSRIALDRVPQNWNPVLRNALKLLSLEHDSTIWRFRPIGSCRRTIFGRLGGPVGLSRSALSRRPARMGAEGVLATRRESRTIYDRIADPAVLTNLDCVASVPEQRRARF